MISTAIIYMFKDIILGDVEKGVRNEQKGMNSNKKKMKNSCHKKKSMIAHNVQETKTYQ
jgi:hypothetical protein